MSKGGANRHFKGGISRHCQASTSRSRLRIQGRQRSGRYLYFIKDLKLSIEPQESKDPLHLCVSSKYSETFTIACKYVEELLRHIYDEYKAYCHKKGYKEIELGVKKMEVSQPNSQQGSFFSDFLPQPAENSLSYNSSFLTATNTNSLNAKFNEFLPAYIHNDRFNRAAAELEGGFKNMSLDENPRAELKAKSQSFQFQGGSSSLNETEEEKAKRKERSMNAWKEKYGKKSNNINE